MNYHVITHSTACGDGRNEFNTKVGSKEMQIILHKICFLWMFKDPIFTQCFNSSGLWRWWLYIYMKIISHLIFISIDFGFLESILLSNVITKYQFMKVVCSILGFLKLKLKLHWTIHKNYMIFWTNFSKIIKK